MLALRPPLARLQSPFGVLPTEIAYGELLAVEVVRPSAIRVHTQTKEERRRRWGRRSGAIFSGAGPRTVFASSISRRLAASH
jgi:hypothetical protein